MAKSDAERKRKQREKEAEHREAVGAELFSMDMFRGTRECLDQLKADHCFEEDGEIVTLLIHNLANCDMSRQSALLQTPELKTA